MGEEGHDMLLLARDFGCDHRVGRTFRTPQYSLYKILYPKRRIESYSILGTIKSLNKMLLI